MEGKWILIIIIRKNAAIKLSAFDADIGSHVVFSLQRFFKHPTSFNSCNNWGRYYFYSIPKVMTRDTPEFTKGSQKSSQKSSNAQIQNPSTRHYPR
jgi:hypothetical protein